MPWLEHPIFYAALFCVGLQLLAWYLQQQTNNADTVDIAWTVGIIVSALVYLIQLPAATWNVWLVVMFPVVWYLRLAVHLLIRYDVRHEDSRYQNLRAHWNQHRQIKFLLFFLFQAALSVLFSLPAYWVLTAAAISWLQATLALLLGGAALIGVTLADRQLLQFKRNHDRSQVCDVGLWRYSRHPNYFFEWLHWFIYPILLWHSPYFWWSVLVVAVMLLFLLKLTGIPFSEQQALQKRGQAYRDYMDKTSPFILWSPKHD